MGADHDHTQKLPEVYEALRSKVDLAVMEWQEWLKTEAHAGDFSQIFGDHPVMRLYTDDSEVWHFDIASLAEGSLALALAVGRSKSMRRPKEGSK